MDHRINRDNLKLIIDNSLRYLSINNSWNINAKNYLRIYTDLIKSNLR